MDEFSDGDLNNYTFITVTICYERKISILPGYGGEDWMGPTPSNSAICRDPAAVLTFGNLYFSGGGGPSEACPARLRGWLGLVWEMLPHPVGVLCTHLGAPSSHIIKKKHENIVPAFFYY